MTKRFATFAAIIALSAAATVAAHAATYSDPAQDQRENAITSQLNQQQLRGSGMSYGTQTYEGIMQSRSPNQGTMQEQLAQPPADSDNLSIIE